MAVNLKMTTSCEIEVSSENNLCEDFDVSQLKFQPICDPVCSLTQKIFIECCEFSSDGKILVYCGADGLIRVTELENSQTRQSKGHDDIIWGVAINSNNELICTCSSDKSIKIWTLKSLELVSTLSEHTDTVWSVKFTIDSKYVISCSSDLKIIIWDFKAENSNHRVLRGHTNMIEDIALSPNGKILLSCSQDITLRVWRNFLQEDYESWILRGHRKRLTCCVFAPHKNHIVASTSADCTVIVWDIYKKSILWTLPGHCNVVWSCSFLKMGTELFLVSCSSDHSVIFWDISTGHILRRIKKFGRPDITDSSPQLLCCRVSPDATKVAVTTSDGYVYLAEIKTI